MTPKYNFILLLFFACITTHAQEYSITEIDSIAYTFFNEGPQYAPGVDGNHPTKQISSIEAISRDSTDYTLEQYAIINIYPNYPSCEPVEISQDEILDTVFAIQNGGGITISDKVVEDYQEGVISSGEYIKLTNGFHAKAGSNLHISIKDMQCNDNQVSAYAPQKNTNMYDDIQWCDQWNVIYHGWIADEIDMPITIFYQLIGDTIINEMEYKKLTAHYSMASPLSREYVAALRFADDKKVFIHYDNTEYLLYDFGAQVGDTLEIFGGIDYYKDFKTLPHVITEIDTLDDGKVQMQLMVNLQDEWHERSIPITWIEGVGSKDGVVQNVATLRIGLGGIELLCAYHNDECIYTTDNPYYTSLGCVYNDPIFSATEEVNAPTQSVQKIMYNGQLLILRDSKTYNVMGVEVGE